MSQDDDAELLARVAWSSCTEPGDPAAVAVVDALGAVEAWQWLRCARERSAREAARMLITRVRELDAATGSTPEPAGEDAGDTGTGGEQALGLRADDTPLIRDPARALRVLTRAVDRWTPRLGIDPRLLLSQAARIGALPLIPGRPGWPDRLTDLGGTVPLCLWVRGEARLDLLVERAVAVVGARAASDYGERVAGDLAAELVRAGVTVISGGAYGIDAAAHHGALSVDGDRAGTIALLAGGPDHLSPAGNTGLLRRIIEQGGAVVAESPPGRPPSRSRFLLRNRLIAALAGATVVVEAGWRSGALSTAHHAGELLRPLGAVPGPVTSPSSAGCHQLLRNGAAVCVTDADEVIELLAGPNAEAVPATRAQAPTLAEPAQDAPAVTVARGGGVGGPATRGASHPSPGSGLTLGVPAPAWLREANRAAAPPGSRRARVLDALSRHPIGVPTLAARAGLALVEVEAELGLLDLAGLVRRSAEGRWSLRPG